MSEPPSKRARMEEDADTHGDVKEDVTSTQKFIMADRPVENWCPHDLHLVKPDGKVITIKPTGDPLRVHTDPPYMRGSIRGVLVRSYVVPRSFSDTDKIRLKHADAMGSILIVSEYCARALVHSDVPYESPLMSPCTQPECVVRDKDGKITGCKALTIHNQWAFADEEIRLLS